MKTIHSAAEAMHITSLQNPRVKEMVRLRDDRKARRESGLTLVEGLDEIMLAVTAGHTPEVLFHPLPEAATALGLHPKDMFTASESVFKKMSYRENPDGWLAIFQVPRDGIDGIRFRDPALVVIVEGVEKPGNLGAILRTADAAKADAVVCCGGGVDLWSPNVIRASRGAAFAVQTAEAPNEEVLQLMKGRGVRVVATTPGASSAYTEVDMRSPTAIVMGAEDLGLSRFWLDRADEQVRIPMAGLVNSLNVSTAAAVILFEAVRQRSAAATG